jgi:hypothetical protein
MPSVSQQNSILAKLQAAAAAVRYLTKNRKLINNKAPSTASQIKDWHGASQKQRF